MADTNLSVIFICFGISVISITLNAQTEPPSVNSGWPNVTIGLDSIRTEFSKTADSLRRAYKGPLSALDSSRAALQRRFYSLYVIAIDSSKIRHAIDSLNDLTKETLTRLNNDLESLKSKTIGELSQKVNGIELPPDVTKKISTLFNEVEKFSISTDDIGVTQFLPTGDLPIDLNNLNLETSIPRLAVDKNLIGGVSNDLGLPENVNAHAEELQQLAKGDPSAIDNLAQTAEQKTAELSGIADIQKEAGVLDKYKSELANVQDPSALKGQGVEQLQQAAMDHFAGKQEILQEAMDKMGKYKDKYASLTSLTDVPFKRRNEMRGKPFIERIVPAFMVQIQKEANHLLVDLNPYVGYRFTGKLTAGHGWNQRIAYDTDDYQFASKLRIYGPRVFAEYNLWKGFHPRVEVEVMNAYVSPLTKPATIDQGSREWVWGVFVGVKKEYKFIKNVKGTVLVMTRLFDPQHKSPYGDIINARFGFEFPMKKKQQKK